LFPSCEHVPLPLDLDYEKDTYTHVCDYTPESLSVNLVKMDWKYYGEVPYNHQPIQQCNMPFWTASSLSGSAFTFSNLVLKYVLFMSKKQTAVCLPCRKRAMDSSWFEFLAPIHPRRAGILVSVSAAVLTMTKFHRLKWFLFNNIYWPKSYSTLIYIHMKSFSVSNLVLKYVLFMSKSKMLFCFLCRKQPIWFFTKFSMNFVTWKSLNIFLLH
jgi:hypothetical protein